MQEQAEQKEVMTEETVIEENFFNKGTDNKKEGSKIGRKKTLIIIIAVVAAAVLIGVGVGCYFIFRPITPEMAVEKYAKAFSAKDLDKLNDIVFVDTDSDIFEGYSSMKVSKVTVKSKNSKYALAECMLKIEKADGTKIEDNFEIYFCKSGKDWQLFSAIDIENRSTQFVEMI